MSEFAPVHLKGLPEVAELGGDRVPTSLPLPKYWACPHGEIREAGWVVPDSAAERILLSECVSVQVVATEEMLRTF